MLKKFLSALALKTYRAPGEWSAAVANGSGPELWGARAKLGLFWLVSVTALVGIGLELDPEVVSWVHATPSVVIGRKAWHALTATGAPCSVTEAVSEDCPASPDNPSLWESPELRPDRRHRLRADPRADFWLGATLSRKQMDNAREAGANQLILGWALGAMEVFVNGSFVAQAPLGARDPVIVSLPINLLSRPQPVRIGLLIHPHVDADASRRPDQLAQPWYEGLATAAQTEAFRSAAAYWRHAGPLMLFFLNALFSLTFLILWSVNKLRQEYFFFALFAAVSELIQVRVIDDYPGYFSAAFEPSLVAFLYCIQGAAGFFLALSFARARRGLFQWGIPIALVLPWAVYAAAESLGRGPWFIEFLRTMAVPGAYLVGGICCILQALHLNSLNPTQKPRSRMLRLIGFGLGMFAMATMYYMRENRQLSFLVQALVSNNAHFILVAILSAVAITEYRRESRLLERAPLSRYHRMRRVPDAVDGAILHVDIKSSELLDRMATLRGQPGQLISNCLSHLWAAAVEAKGVVIETSGDGLIALFDTQAAHDSLVAGLQATILMRHRLDAYCKQAQEQGLLSPEVGICFRAGLALGRVRPIWRKVEGFKVAGWIDADEGQPFVEGARLMEIERKIPQTAGLSCVVLDQKGEGALHEGSPSLPGSWPLKGVSFEGKHGRLYTVDVFCPGAGPGSGSRRSAGADEAA